MPKRAEWAGGVDGGSWVACEPAEEKWRYDCVVYDESTGKIEARGRYVLVSVYWDEEKHKSLVQRTQSLTLRYDSFDGDTIRLQNSLALVREDQL